MTIRFFCFAVLLCIVTNLRAQLNIKIGYEMVFVQPEGTQAVIDAYNAQNTWLTDGFDDINYLHGFHTGLRYQAEPFAWEATYAKRFNVRQASGDDPDFGPEVTRKLAYDLELVSVGQEFQIADFGLGITIDYNWVDIRTEVVDQDDARTVVRDDAWSSQLYLAYHTPKASFISLSIQPYVQYYWDEFDVSALSQELKVSNVSETKDKLFIFGVKFIFNNGK